MPATASYSQDDQRGFAPIGAWYDRWFTAEPVYSTSLPVLDRRRPPSVTIGLRPTFKMGFRRREGSRARNGLLLEISIPKPCSHGPLSRRILCRLWLRTNRLSVGTEQRRLRNSLKSLRDGQLAHPSPPQMRSADVSIFRESDSQSSQGRLATSGHHPIAVEPLRLRRGTPSLSEIRRCAQRALAGAHTPDVEFRSQMMPLRLVFERRRASRLGHCLSCPPLCTPQCHQR